ncbi:hypothetical protein MHB48_11870 [Psychrobacillus sp. FSL H8-0483]|uniref:hypothetical protein n=1 Tax=Psychrobacillus sp. FSL H8-0483 TaxID=2921389 RepID=UPI003159F797
MPLEKEIFGLLIGGSAAVMGIAIFVTLFLWIKNNNKNSGYVWTLLHLMLFSIAIYFTFQVISIDYNHPMASEEISLQLGIAGVIWALSMTCLIVGIFNFSKSGKYSSS